MKSFRLSYTCVLFFLSFSSQQLHLYSCFLHNLHLYSSLRNSFLYFEHLKVRKIPHGIQTTRKLRFNSFSAIVDTLTHLHRGIISPPTAGFYSTLSVCLIIRSLYITQLNPSQTCVCVYALCCSACLCRTIVQVTTEWTLKGNRDGPDRRRNSLSLRLK